MSEVQIVDNMIDITIDGVEYKAKEGEYILNAARANEVFIPAICYLTRCSPTLACRICLVEADGKQVYACNSKVKEGMQITVDTPDILAERRAMMEVYDVNHPLQCGVCDQSGECELQNYTLELQVDSQSYSIPDTKRETTNWSSVLHYDPGLCIVCERCTTVCKDMIGDSAITTAKRGGEALDKSWKENMPKDAYAMWNKLQKSVIAPSNGTGSTDCSDCGECIAVCPVGALVSRDFVYSSNAWDLKRIPAVSAHSSDGFAIYYETKPAAIEDRSEKIFRVTNEWNFVSLDGAARFGYDFENSGVTKDETAFKAAVDAIKKAETIRFNSLITNEEALMLQTLKEKRGVKLYNPEVRPFQKFLKLYSDASGASLYNGTTDTALKCDFVVSVGGALRNDSPGLKYAFNNIQKMNKGAGMYFHPVGDKLIPTFGKTVEMFTHKVGLEEATLYLLLNLFADPDKLPSDVKEYVLGLNRDDLLTLLGADATAFNKGFDKMMKKKERFVLMVGEDYYGHAKAENLAKLIVLLEEAAGFQVVMNPPKSNALGVALICDLDDDASGYTVGYNENADFKLSALGTGDLDMPALNQQEGTFTTLNKRVVPTNVAMVYGGYVLNDLMAELMDAPRETIEWTPHLPIEKGYQAMEFDDMLNTFDNAGKDNRGYLLNVTYADVEVQSTEKFDEADTLDGDIVYRCNPPRQFNDFSDKAHQIFEAFGLYASPARAEALGAKAELLFKNGKIIVDVLVDPKMEGDVVALADFKSAENVYDLFGASRYQKVTIRKV
ncbi:MAG: NADH-ubiquinone oxidoreductase chain G (EC [uncultured Sulfurovum sp.]|uniref:NADH-ubiquinone oxidoreductase chain G (EC) n=1 Tax=uncultured Sulfurovum sp. TaxID=269237 RepID=A0A6S6THS6_9BACT|nr:MAG: NADH-ubiquinone oxidoreductase chain G (EC [uncultured Sulfurovum sp.]